MSLFHLYAAVEIVPAQVLRPVHVGFMLLLVFLLFPVTKRYRNRLMWWDIVCALVGVATIAYLLDGGDDFWDRNTLPSPSDTFFGVTFVVLVLEACRRTSGWIMLVRHRARSSRMRSWARGCPASGSTAATTCRA